MQFPQSFIDTLRERTAISVLIGRAVKLTKKGREFKACCPFHNEKTPSFTINDEKGFGHCFGCGWHGDVFRWLADHAGLSFPDAVRELAAEAGLEVPEPDPRQAARQERIETVRAAIDAAQTIYAGQIMQSGAVMEYLCGRGVTPGDIEMFGIGYARGGDGSLKGRGIGAAIGREAGLLIERADGRGLREQFWDRITIPIHDRRGCLIGFGGRVWPGPSSGPGSSGSRPKFVNSPDSALFDKGRTLFNLHRAAPFARPQAENRFVLVEGYFDVIAMTAMGIRACAAPLGTALTEAQIAMAWRLHNRPTLMFDGDAAGRKAAVRACGTALPRLAAGRELAIAMLPEGKDPDDLRREMGDEAAAREIEAVLAEARALHDFLFDAVRLDGGDSPEGRAAVWGELARMAGSIVDDETRGQYLGMWRARFDREVSALAPAAPSFAAEPLHAVQWTEDGDYAFLESESDSERRLIAIVRAVLRKREERRAINEEIADLMKMAEAIGFVKKEIGAVIRDIESDLAHGSGVREEAEMVRVLYRRALGIRGPMSEAMMPQLVDGRARPVNAQVKRRATMNALIDARAVEI